MPVNSWLYVLGGATVGTTLGNLVLPKQIENAKTTAPYEIVGLWALGVYYNWPMIQSYGEFVGSAAAVFALNAVAPIYIGMRE